MATKWGRSEGSLIFHANIRIGIELKCSFHQREAMEGNNRPDDLDEPPNWDLLMRLSASVPHIPSKGLTIIRNKYAYWQKRRLKDPTFTRKVPKAVAAFAPENLQAALKYRCPCPVTRCHDQTNPMSMDQLILLRMGYWCYDYSKRFVSALFFS